MSDALSVARPGLKADLTDRVLTLTFGNASNGNVISGELARSMREFAESLQSVDGIGAILLRSEGPVFCGGGDGAYMHENAANAGSIVKQLAEDFHGSMRALLATGAPIVVSVQGPAAGAGMSITCLADIVIAAPSAKFVTAYAQVGLTPDGGMSWTLARLIGMRRATELLLTGRPVTAEEALKIGLINEIVDQSELDARALESARSIARGSAAANAQTKRLLRDAQSGGLTEHLDAEAESISLAAAAPDGLEGIAAFIERRAPEFNRT